MPLIKNGSEAENSWSFIEGDDALPGEGSITVSLARLLGDADALVARNAPIGVRLEPQDDPSELVPFLDRLSLIEVSFPKYTDGRGYSQAQLLRRRFGYSGELRAVGHVLRDQILYMNRSGFDAFVTERADLSDVMEALGEYPAYYQPAANSATSVFGARHGKV